MVTSVINPTQPQYYKSGFYESDVQAKMLGRDVTMYTVKKQRGWVIFVHRKRDAFSLSLYLCPVQVSTLSLPN